MLIAFTLLLSEKCEGCGEGENRCAEDGENKFEQDADAEGLDGGPGGTPGLAGVSAAAVFHEVEGENEANEQTGAGQEEESGHAANHCHDDGPSGYFFFLEGAAGKHVTAGHPRDGEQSDDHEGDPGAPSAHHDCPDEGANDNEDGAGEHGDHDPGDADRKGHGSNNGGNNVCGHGVLSLRLSLRRRGHLSVYGPIPQRVSFISPYPTFSNKNLTAWAKVFPARITGATLGNMSEIPVRALRNESASVLSRVASGEELTVTRAGTPVARILPLRKKPLTAEQLVARRKGLPKVDFAALRNDIDEIIDSSL